jgi:hypothetical protein
MTEVLERAITAETMRTEIRAKIRAGVSRRAISLLIYSLRSPDSPFAGRDEGTGVPRLPVEAIPNGQRPAFIAALNRLQDDLPKRATKIFGVAL